MPFQVGQRVGDYEVVQLLGAGGMGHVYRVRNIISNRTEAMKVLLPDLTAEPDLATRFISEIRTLASFDHPNIAQLHTALLAENQLIMMMEYVEGYTLEQMAGQRTQPINEVAGYVMQALSALAYAHERGVVHRDIKPANLMVTSHGIVKLMDFGIAKSNTENINHTRPGTTIGSLYYMSPEQVRGSAVDARSDLYSMGVVLYEMLAGRRPFEADSTFGILNAQLNTPPQPPMEVNPSVPPQMNDIILRALAKDPAQRFQNAEEFRTALRSFMSAPSPQEAAPPAQAYQAPPAPLPSPQSAPQPAPQAYAASQAAPQAGPQQPAPAYGGQPATPQWQGVAPAQMPPPARRSGNKPLWIATGAIAAVLALVMVGFAIPPLLKKTHAATNPNAASTPSTAAPSAVVTAATEPIPTTQTPGPEALPTPNPGIGIPPSARNDRSPQAPIERPGDNSRRASGGQMPPSGIADHAVAPGNQGGYSAPAAAAAPASSAELEQAEERMSQIGARANAAKRGVGQIRSQQEAQGLGMRGDIETAESQLESYLGNAQNALARGDGAAATRALDKADMQLTKLEKFLGR